MKRTKRIELRVSEEELGLIKNNARMCGNTVGRFVRERSMMLVEPRPAISENEKQLLRELSAIGNNLNQIALKLNRGEHTVMVDIENNQLGLSAVIEKLLR